MDLNSVQDLKNAYPKLLEEYAEEVKASVVAEVQEEGEMAELKANLKEATDELSKTVTQRDEALKKVAILESRGVLEEKLGKSKLHETLKKRVRADFADKIVEAAALDAALTEYEALAAALAEKPIVEGVKPETDGGSDETDKDLLYRVFGMKDGE